MFLPSPSIWRKSHPNFISRHACPRDRRELLLLLGQECHVFSGNTCGGYGPPNGAGAEFQDRVKGMLGIAAMPPRVTFRMRSTTSYKLLSFSLSNIPYVYFLRLSLDRSEAYLWSFPHGIQVYQYIVCGVSECKKPTIPQMHDCPLIWRKWILAMNCITITYTYLRKACQSTSP